jgi:hypothetical protein
MLTVIYAGTVNKLSILSVVMLNVIMLSVVEPISIKIVDRHKCF